MPRKKKVEHNIVYGVAGGPGGNLVFIPESRARALAESNDDEDRGDPPWPEAEQFDWMPQDVLDMGDPGAPPGDCPPTSFQPEQEEDVVAALARHGFMCRRDDDLVTAASGLC